MNNTERRRLLHAFFTPDKKTVTANEISAAMRLVGVRSRVIAKECGVTDSVVSEVISGKATSRKVAMRIANMLDIPLESLWPGKYGTNKKGKAK